MLSSRSRTLATATTLLLALGAVTAGPLPAGAAPAAPPPATVAPVSPDYRLLVAAADESETYLGPQDSMPRAPYVVDSNLQKPYSLLTPLSGAPADSYPEVGQSRQAFAFSPDGTRVAFLLRDAKGHFVPGGTPETSEPGVEAGYSLVVMDVDGRHRKLLYTGPRNDRASGWLSDYAGVSWKDDDTVLVPGTANRALAPEGMTGWIGVLYAFDADDGARSEALRVEDGPSSYDYIREGAGGGGTVVGRNDQGSPHVIHRDGSTADLPEAGTSTDDYYYDIQVSPDGDHLAVVFKSGRTYRTDIWDYHGEGTWTRRTIDTSPAGSWVRWLPYDSFDAAQVVVEHNDYGDLRETVQLRAAAGVTDAERRVRAYGGDQAYGIWQVQPAPKRGAGAADVSVSSSTPDATGEKPWQGSLTVTNHGPDTATGVSVITDLRDNALSTLSGPSGALCTVGTGVCDLPDLPPGASMVLTVGATPAAAGIERLRSRVVADQVDWDLSDSVRNDQLRVRAPGGGGTATGRLLTQRSCQTGATYCSQIVLVDADGTDPVVVQSSTGYGYIALWQADPAAGTFVWSSTPAAGGAATWHVSRFDGTEMRRFAPPQGMRLGSVSADGRTLAYVHEEMEHGFPTGYVTTLRLGVNGAQPRTVATVGPRSVINQLRFAPDGTRLAYVEQIRSSNAELVHVVDLDGRHDRTVPSAVPGAPDSYWYIHNQPPIWSPDGGKLALGATDDDDPRTAGVIWLADVDQKGEPRTLAPAPKDANDNGTVISDWSPDGSQVLAQSYSRLVRINTTTGAHTDLGLKVGFATPVFYTGLAAIPGGTGGGGTGGGDGGGSGGGDGGGTGGGGTTPDTTAPVASYTASPAGALRRSGTLTVTRDQVSDDTDTPAQLAVSVDWGDGASSAGTGATASFAHAYSTQGTREVTVTVRDRAGNTTTALTRSVVVDGTPPAMSITRPSCGRRTKKQCAAYLSARSTWGTVRGTVSDTGGSGLGSVTVSAVQLRGKKWFALTSSGWKAYASQTLAIRNAQSLPVTRSGSAWSLKLAGLAKGKLMLTGKATDSVGNPRTTTLSQSLR